MSRLASFFGLAIPCLILFSACGLNNGDRQAVSKSHWYQEPTAYFRSDQTLPYGAFRPEKSGLDPVLPELPEKSSQGFLSLSEGVVYTDSSSWGGSKHEWIPMDGVAIFLDGDMPALHIIAQTLVRDFAKLPHFKKIIIYPKGTGPQEGERAPDLFLRLRIQEGARNGEDENDKDPELAFIGGSSILGGFDPSWQDGEPPLPTWQTSGEIKPLFENHNWPHDAANARLVADRISGKLIDSLRKKFTSFREDKSVLPALPESFYPDYRPTPEFAFLAKHDAHQLASLHGLVTPNITWWSFSSNHPPAELFETITSNLASEGWTVDRTHLADEAEDRSFIELIHEDLHAELRIGHHYSDAVQFIEDHEDSNVVLVLYRQLLPVDQRGPMIDNAIKSRASSQVIATLPAFLDHSGNHPGLTEAILDAVPKMHPEDFIHAINYLQFHTRNPEAAHELLIQAAIKMIAFQTPSELFELLDDEMEASEYGKDLNLNDPKLIPLTIQPDQQKKFGILNPENFTSSASFKRAVGEPFVVMPEKDKLCGIVVYSARPLLDDSDGSPSRSLVLRSFSLNGDFDAERQSYSSWGSGGQTQGIAPGEDCHVTLKYLESHPLHIQVDSDGESIKISVSNNAGSASVENGAN